MDGHAEGDDVHWVHKKPPPLPPPHLMCKNSNFAFYTNKLSLSVLRYLNTSVFARSHLGGSKALLLLAQLQQFGRVQ